MTKTYRRYEKEEGLTGSVKSLFRRKFIDKVAVDHLDLQVRAGEFVGLIGPNGAGKTTLTKLMTGIIRKSGGELSVLGRDPNRLENDFRRRYAVVMGQKSQLFMELSAADTFLLMQKLYEIPEAEYRRNLNYFVELFGVSGQINVQVRTLSLGERMKMELICALIHNPNVLFLDEPTIGLDAVAQRQIRRFLSDVNRQRGTTIVLTSHYMEDIRALCERCVVISGGKKLYDGSTDALFARYQTHRKLTVTVSGDEALNLPADAELIEHTGEGKSVLLVPRTRTQQILRDLLLAHEILDIAVEEEDIGEVVERIYAGGDGR